MFKYGFENLLEHLNLAQFIARGIKVFRRGNAQVAHLSSAERMRLVFEELGPTFIKLGQMLSTRPDIVPAKYIIEFQKLQDRVPGFPLSEVKKQITSELGAEIEDLFSSFSEVPIAAASIAQVHRARLHGGDDVVVKVRRPGVEELAETDLDVLMGLSLLAERRFAGSEPLNPVGLVREFARTYRREMDLSREGKTIERISADFAGHGEYYFPRVFWGQTSKGVLTLEYVEGIKVSDTDALVHSGCDLKLIARRGADFFLQQVLIHGFFHGDPHPGNVFILPGNVICLIDYGIMGRLDPQSKDFLIDFLHALVNRDVDKIVSVLLYSGDITDIYDISGLKRDLSDFIEDYCDYQPREIVVGRMFLDFIETISAYRIRFRPDFILLAKALIAIEGMGRELDPDFNMISHVRPFVEKAVLERYSIGRLSRDTGSALRSYVSLARSLPDDIKEILNRINRNKFKIDLEHRGLDQLIRELDKASNRLSSSLVLTALIVGSSLILQTTRGPQLMGFPMLAVLGYSIAALLGLWLVLAIFRSGRL